MADNINFNRLRGTFSIVTVREPAWHRLGKTVPNNLTIAEATVMANLDFEVGKADAYANVEYLDEGMEIATKLSKIPNKFATYRKDTGDILGSVGATYEIIQNIEAFSFFDQFIHESDAIVQTAGALGKGEQVFISVKLPAYIKVAEKDVVEQYLLLSTSHDGSRSIEMMFTPIRVVCYNTLNAALSSSASRVKIRHTSSARDKLKEAHRILGISNERTEFMKEVYPILAKTQVDEKGIKNYINNVFLNSNELALLADIGTNNVHQVEEISTRKANIIDDVYKAYYVGPGQQLDSAKGTAWGVYNAVTCYYHNIKKEADASKSMRSNYYGANFDIMQKAFKEAVALSQ